jgi:signal transduction histidine kinase
MEIRKHPFVTKFPKTEAEQIVASSKIQVYKAGTIIFEEDSISNLLYLLLEGDVDFLKKTNTGKYSAVSSSEAGCFFGELGILTGESRKLRAKARNDVRVAEVPGALLMDFLKKSSPFLLEVLHNVTTHLKTTTDHYLQERIQKEKLQAVGQMVRSIVHDLRNPFSIISLATYMIGQEHDDKKTQEQCDLIKDQTNYVMALAEDITAFSEGYKSLKRITVPIKDVFAKFQVKHEQILKTSTCPIEFIDNDISANLDQDKMIRVLKNLVENAIESVDTKSNGRIRVLARAKDGELSLSVADNGRGIPEEIREYLFEPFAAPPGGKEGSGLGAAIAKSVVEAHNGRLTYASETGKGTTFTIRIPME